MKIQTFKFVCLVVTLYCGHDRLHADNPYSPELGSAVRSEICNVLREHDQSASKFVIEFLTIDGSWAGFSGYPEDEGADALFTSLLFKGENGKWQVKTLKAHGDVLLPEEFTGGAVVPLSVYPIHVLQAEARTRKTKSQMESAGGNPRIKSRNELLTEIFGKVGILSDLRINAYNSRYRDEVLVNVKSACGSDEDFIYGIFEKTGFQKEDLEDPTWSTKINHEISTEISDLINKGKFSESEKVAIRIEVLRALDLSKNQSSTTLDAEE